MDENFDYFFNKQKEDDTEPKVNEPDVSAPKVEYVPSPPEIVEEKTPTIEPVVPVIPNNYQQNGAQNQQTWQQFVPPTQGYATPQQTATPFVNPTSIVEEPADDPSSKAHKRTVFIIIVIIVTCAVLSVLGIQYAINHPENLQEPKQQTTQADTADAEKVTGGDAVAEVHSSAEPAKKDADGNLTAAGVVQKVVDSCVGITVYTSQSNYSYFNNYGSSTSSNGDTPSGEGSGVIMAESDGKTYIMTCAHVISDGSSFEVTLNDDTKLDAKLVGFDNQTDIGVLVVEKTGLQVVEFGDSKDLQVGAPCVAIGCPGGLEFMNSVTQGIISAVARPISSTIGYDNKCIQVDAAINPGNSGGALFNMQGQCIGINSSKIAATEYEGMGFAVPSNTAVETANSLIKNGYVAGRARLGITYNNLSNYSSAYAILDAIEDEGYKDAEGTIVIQEVDDESGLAGKVQQYDMIVAVNGKVLTTTDVLTSVLSDSKPGDTVTLVIARIDGKNLKTFEVKCKLIESKE